MAGNYRGSLTHGQVAYVTKVAKQRDAVGVNTRGVLLLEIVECAVTMGASPWTMRGSKGTCCNSLKGFKYQAIPRSCLLFVHRPCVHGMQTYKCARTKALSKCFV